MKLKKSLLLLLLCSLTLQAQDGELSLDPNDIPLTPDPALEAPAESTITVPPLDAPPPTSPPPTTGTDSLPTTEVVTPQAEPAPLISPRVEEYTPPTPSNLEVKNAEATPNADATSDTTKKEERFSKTYSKFHKSSTSEQNWEKVVGKRTSDTYVVNKGDTLWDISGTLFGDPFYWPKVWSLNREMIYNPHVIFPDMKIKFYQGSSKTTPTLATDNQPVAVDAKKDEVAVTPEGPAVENENVAPAPNNVKMTSALKKLPRFFKDVDVKIKKQVDTLQVEEHQSVSNDSAVKFEFYISEAPLTAVGKIIEVESELKSAGFEQYVFVKFEAEPTGVYTVVRTPKVLKETKDSTVAAELYEVEGELKILGRVNTGENVYRAQVIRSANLVSEGSILVPGRMRSFNLKDMNKETTANKGRIIGNLNDYGIVGQGSFVLINQGAQSGYQSNMTLPIYEDLSRRNPRSLVKENPQKVGSVVIVDSTENFSIGYISKVYENVLVSDFVGMAEGGEFNPQGSARAEEIFEEVQENVTPSAPSEELPADEF